METRSARLTSSKMVMSNLVGGDQLSRFTEVLINEKLYKWVLLLLFLIIGSMVSATKYYLSPTGSDSNTGSISSPFFTLNKAWTLVVAGDTVYMRGGTYLFNSQQILIGKSGTAANMIKVWAYPGETPVLSKSASYTTNYGVRFEGNYVYFRGLEIKGYAQLSGQTNVSSGLLCWTANYCIFENLNIHDNGQGMVIRGDGANGCAVGATGNLIKNCDFHHNKDPYSNLPYNNASGLSVGYILSDASSNRVVGCRFYWNTDNGIDCWKNDGTMIIDSCWSFYNGYLPGTFTASAGNGDGYKLGSTHSMTMPRTLRNCVAFKNLLHGFDDNSAPDVTATLYNNIAYLNAENGFNFNQSGVVHTIKNNIAYQNSFKNAIINAVSTVSNSTFLNGVGQTNTSYSVSAGDFLSLDTTGITGPRQPDGSLPLLNFLHLASGSDLINTGVNVGLPYIGTAPDLGPYEFSSSSGSTNQAPIIVNQSFSIAENAVNGTLVGTVVASDPNSGQTLSYSILSGNTSGAFTLNSTTGVLSVANSAALNYETTPAFSLTVKVQDNGSPTLSAQATVSVNLINVNEAPVITNQSFSVIANSAVGTQIGTVVATDPDAGQILTYSILSGNTNGAFSIGGQTGVLIVANSAALNITTNPSFSLAVKVQDNGTGTLSSQAVITIVLTAANTAPVISSQVFTIAENTANGAVVGTVTASDPNAGQTLSFSILSGNTSGAFVINSATGVLSVANSSAVNYELNPSFALTVKVADNGSPSLSSQAIITVNLTDINEVPVIYPQIFSVQENSANGTSVGTVMASDADAGQTITYSIISGNTGGAFSINSANGLISVNTSSVLDYEQIPTFILLIRVQDNGTGNLSSQANITINLTDVNEPPVTIDENITISSVPLDGMQVGNVSATDPDIGQTLTYSIYGGNTNNAFSIGSSTGILTVANSSAISYTTNPQYDLDIRVTDNGSGNLFDDAAVLVSFSTNATNQAPVIVNQCFSTNENTANGTYIGAVVAYDPDAGQQLTYSILSGNVSGAFAIEPSTGMLSVSNSDALDYENTPAFSLIVNVQDNASVSASAQATVTVNLININEPPQISNQAFSVTEYAAKNTVVGTVVASDPDAGQSLTYAITAGNTSNAFSINQSNGRIKVNNRSALNYAVNPVFYLTVRVKDNGAGQLASYATISIYVIPIKSDDMVNIVSLPLDTVTVGVTYNYQVVGFSRSSSMLHFSADMIPAWLSLTDNNDGTATLQGTPGIQDIGEQQVVLKGFDSLFEVEQSYTIQVKLAPEDQAGLHSVIGIKVYPNPVIDKRIYVKLDTEKNEQYDLSIMDLSGKVLLVRHNERSNPVVIDVSAYPPAVYLIKVSSPHYQFTEKFMIE